MTTKNTKAAVLAAQDANVTKVAAAIVANESPEQAVRRAVREATTVAGALAAASGASRFVRATEASSFDAIMLGRIAAAEGVYAAARFALLAQDANAKVPAAKDWSFTKAAAAAFGAGKNTKETYETLALKDRPIQRAWSSLSEDWSLMVLVGAGEHRAAFDIWRGERTASYTLYVEFLRGVRAGERADAKERGEDVSETPQSRGARTKAAIAETAARVKRDQDAAKAARVKAVKDAADKRVTHISTHPAASVVTGFDALSGADLMACRDRDILNALIATVTAWRDHLDASKGFVAAAKADTPAAPAPDVLTTLAAADVATVPAPTAEPTMADLMRMMADLNARIPA